MNNLQMDTIQKAQRVTQDYASYSWRKNGLGTTLGGIIGIAIYLVNLLFSPGLVTTALTIGLTIGWLIGKEVIRQRLYRTFGYAQELWPSRSRWSHFFSIVLVELCIAGCWYVFLSKLHSQLLYWILAAVSLLVIPWICWRYLRNGDEFVIGVFLLVACIINSVGTTMPHTIEQVSGTLVFPLIGLGMIVRGIQEHREFRSLSALLCASEKE
ncbi:hypothetical protein [Dictyobacter kobayashii]|uniref:Uncharacterized protein n=1 Tax=Dictyobacter kobayashii TaxID=2014872 RepID=A0A402AQ55_9CHLR|nr:hypothetical protein [Dictyobacter kobayashii]GCE21246.1 hypothetical protein KDK_50460 [Dictyobacter kobayashii]